MSRRKGNVIDIAFVLSWCAFAAALIPVVGFDQGPAKPDFSGGTIGNETAVMLASMEVGPESRSIVWRTRKDSNLEVGLTSDGGEPLTMLLQPLPVRGDSFKLLGYDASGKLIEFESPESTTYRGTIVELPGSRVAASVRNNLLYAIVFEEGTTWSWSIEPTGVQTHLGDDLYQITYAEDHLEILPVCAAPNVNDRHGSCCAPAAASSGDGGSASCGAIARVAIDVDYSFFAARGESVEETVGHVESIVNATNIIYEDFVGIRHDISAIVIRTSEAEDPYQGTTPTELLHEMTEHWNLHHADIQRDAAHLFSGIQSPAGGAGVANIGTVCNVGEAYAVSLTDLFEVFPHQVSLVAHELGHNWNAQHCMIDPYCAIMHWMVGAGVSDSQFAPSTVQAIKSYRDSQACLEPASFFEWSAVSTAELISGEIYSLAFSDGQIIAPGLYVGGEFTVSGGSGAAHIARWDGESWHALGTGVNARVETMLLVEDASAPGLYVGGSFTTAGGTTVNRIARWDGDAWHPVGAGFNGTVRAIATFDDESGSALYATGSFTSADGLTAAGLAHWTGETWVEVGGGINGSGHALYVEDLAGTPRLVVGGSFTAVGGGAAGDVGKHSIGANNVAAWDGLTWSNFGDGVPGPVHAISAVDHGSGQILYFGGAFSWPGEANDPNLVGWDGADWIIPAVNGQAAMGPVFTLDAMIRNGQHVLLVGGEIPWAGGDPAYNVLTWDGTNWLTFGTGVIDEGFFGGKVRAVTLAGSTASPDVFVGGSFSLAGGQHARNVAKWTSAGPTIVSQPTSLSVTAGDSAAFAVDVVGDEVGFQWMMDDAPLADDDRISGTTTATLTIDPVHLDDAGSYAVLVTGACGSETSLPAELDVVPRTGDLNGDGVVDVFDLLILLSAWGPCGDPADCAADLNGDGIVDVFDLLILLNHWG